MSFLGLFKKEVYRPSPHRKKGNYMHKSLVKRFDIRLNEPHRIWKPDEYIGGETILDIKKDVTNIALRLKLVSEAKVTSSVGGTKLRTKKTENLLEKTTFLYGYENNRRCQNEVVNGLTQGEHIFPFKIRLPNCKKLFSSIKFERGSINHYLECSLESMGESQFQRPFSKCIHFFLVKVPLDVSYLPDPTTKTVVLQSASPVQRSNSRMSLDNGSLNTRSTEASDTSMNSFGDKIVKVSVNLSKGGYCVGEAIPVSITLHHYKNFCHPAGLIITLSRICRVGSGVKDEPAETFRKDICQTIKPIYLDPESHCCSLIAYLKVPIDAFSTFTNLEKFFAFQYYIEVMVNLSPKNIVLTESNRVIEGLHEVGKPASAESSSGLEENLVRGIPRSFVSMISKSGNLNEGNFDESSIIYEDMVNVERLKRMNNVTGMSIETIIGTERSTSRKESSPEVLELPSHLSEDPVSNPKPMIDEWLSPLEAYPPVPEYTPNNNIKIMEDKQELERERLKQLESDPPNNY